MPHRFWSSVVLTGNPTRELAWGMLDEFWSSVVLTGKPTYRLYTPTERKCHARHQSRQSIGYTAPLNWARIGIAA